MGEFRPGQIRVNYIRPLVKLLESYFMYRPMCVALSRANYPVLVHRIIRCRLQIGYRSRDIFIKFPSGGI